MKTKKLNKKRVVIALILFVVLVCLIFVSVFAFNMSAVSKSNKSKTFTIESGTPSNTIMKNLEKEGLIKNYLTFKIYTKLKGDIPFKAGSYEIKSNLNGFEMYDYFASDKMKSAQLSITFNEGTNINKIATAINEKTGISKDEVFNKLKDTDYINSLIKKYWFLTDDILNKEIYYPLEGYLYPDTYFIEKDISVEEIFKLMLDKMNIELSKYKEDIEKNELSIHEIITLASVVEIEGKTKEDKEKVASVFLNRLDSNMNLGSCVTAYYANKKEMSSDNPLTKSDIAYDSPYNTYLTSMAGRLPVGPVSNPSIVSINAVVNPIATDYYYFLNDIYGILYFNETASGHQSTIARLQKEGKF